MTDQTEYYKPHDPYEEPCNPFIAFHLTNPNLESFQTYSPTNHGIYELPDSPIPELESPLDPWEHLQNFQVQGLHPMFDITQHDPLFRLPFFVQHHWLNIHAFYYDIDIEDLIHQRYLGTHTDISRDY